MESLLYQSKKVTRLHWPERISKYGREDYGNIPIKLDLFIERIYLSSSSQDWHIDLVNSIAKKYNMNKEIIKSKLYSLPYIYSGNLQAIRTYLAR
jgi:hypothetical protein